MSAVRYALLTVALLVAGCSSPDATLVPDDASFTVSVPEGDAVDLHFQPQQLRHGERVTVQVRGLRLESEARTDGHAVRLDAPGRTVHRVTGLVDGRTQAVVDVETSGGAPGGLTTKPPTSVHTIRVCNATSCSETVEYDYDLHAPSGDGTTAWRTPDGRSVTIDRLRFELAATAAARPGHATLTVTAPQPLVFVR